MRRGVLPILECSKVQASGSIKDGCRVADNMETSASANLVAFTMVSSGVG